MHPKRCGREYWRGRTGRLALLVGLLAAVDLLAQAGMRELMRARRDALLTQTDWQRPGSQQAQWLKGFIEDLGQRGRDRDAQEWEDALRCVTGIARRDYLLLEATGFVDDPAVVPILAAALGEPSYSTRDFALRTLIWQTRQADLEQSAAAVRQALGTPRLDEEWRLWAKLPLADAEKRDALARPDLEPEVRARLGSSQAENELILAFGRETDFGEKEHFARLLGYVGTPPCARALVDGLRSPVAIDSQYEERSIRVPILAALGLIHQDEPLFTRDARLLTESGEDVFDRWRGLAAYAQDVDTWVRARYGAPAWGDTEVWFKRSRHLPLLTPGAVPTPAPP